MHRENDQRLGAPICADCYDWDGTVIWNARTGLLWTRTVLAIRRALAATAGLSVRALGDHYTVAYGGLSHSDVR